MNDCYCGFLFGTSKCLDAHAAAKARMEPLDALPHEHHWLKPVRGIMYCGSPGCDALARVEYR